MQVAVLGMGGMGRAVAERLVETGHQVTVWNRTPGRAGDVVASGAKEASGPAAAVEGAQVALLSLANDHAVLEVAHGLVEHLGATVLIDSSTVAPATTRELAELVGERLLAAPILGGPGAVQSATALYLVGGPKDTVDGVEGLFSDLTASWRWVGEDPGAATTVKVLCNSLLLSGLAALAEAVATGQAAGLSDDVLRQLFSSIPVVAPALHNRLDDLLTGDHQGWFSARLGAKDARLVGGLGASVGLDLPLADAVAARYEALVDAGFGEADIAAIVELLR